MSNGNFTQISNDLLEALCRTRIPGEARQLFDCILRKTLGWNKESDVISISQFREITGLSNSAIFKARSRLVAMNMIRATQLGTGLSVRYSIITAYATWKPLPKKVRLPNRVAPLPKKVQNTTQLATTIEKKETIQKKQPYDQTLFDRFWSAYPNKKNKGQAEKTWNKIQPSNELVTEIITALDRQKKSKQWLKDDGEFIPHPSTWLNAKGWLNQEPNQPKGKTYEVFDGIAI